MKKQNKSKIFFLILLLGLIFFAQGSRAFCPVCTVSVGAFVGLSQYLGIDDSISGLWIGSLLVSLSLWSIDYLDKKKIKFKFRNISVFLIMYAATFIPLYFSKIVGHSGNKIWGIDKLILGVILGSVAFLVSLKIYERMKIINNGKAYFPFQKVVMPIALLLVLSLIFEFVVLPQIS